VVTPAPSRVWPKRSCLHRFIVLMTLVAAALPFVQPGAETRRRPAHHPPRQPISMSIHEEGTISVVLPMMGVFNNSWCSTSMPGRTASTASCRTSQELEVERRRQATDLRAPTGRDLA